MSKKLREGYLGQTLEDFLDVCPEPGMIDEIVIYGEEEDPIFRGTYDELPFELLQCGFIECGTNERLVVNVISSEEYGRDAYYEFLGDFLEDCNIDEIEVFDLDTAETIFRGDKEECPEEILEMAFGSFDAPHYISVNVEELEEIEDISDLELDEDELEVEEKLDEKMNDFEFINKIRNNHSEMEVVDAMKGIIPYKLYKEISDEFKWAHLRLLDAKMRDALLKKLGEEIKEDFLKEAKLDYSENDLGEFTFEGKEYWVEGAKSHTRDYHWEEIWIREKKSYDVIGYGKYKWLNRPWYRFTYADAFRSAFLDAFGNNQKQFIDELIGKANSIKDLCKMITENSPKEEVKEALDEITQELIDNFVAKYGIKAVEFADEYMKGNKATYKDLLTKKDAFGKFAKWVKKNKDVELKESLGLQRNELEKIIEELYEELKKDNMYVEMWVEDGEIVADIDGDWKHDHAYFDYVVREYLKNKGFRAYINQVEAEDEDGMDDFYHAYHYIDVFEDKPMEFNLDESLKEDLESDLTFLAKDEQEAIDGYDKVINKEKGKKIAKELKIIRDEEEDHLDFLNKAKTNKDLEYKDIHEGLNEKLDINKIKEVVNKYDDAIYLEDEGIVDCASEKTCLAIAKELGLDGYHYSNSPVAHQVFVDESLKDCKKERTIKIKDPNKKREIEIKDKSEVGEPGNPIQRGIKGINKLESLSEKLDESEMDFKVFGDLSEYVDSMLFDAPETIARLDYKNYKVIVDVSGEKKLYYKDEMYTEASDYPQELINLFKTGQAYGGDIDILDNNWFDIVIYKDGEYETDDVFEEDLCKLTEDELKSIMIDYLEWYLDDEIEESFKDYSKENIETLDIHVYDIDWETDLEEVELPKECDIEIEHISEEDKDLDKDKLIDEIADELSNQYGWLVNTFNFDILNELTDKYYAEILDGAVDDIEDLRREGWTDEQIRALARQYAQEELYDSNYLKESFKDLTIEDMFHKVAGKEFKVFDKDGHFTKEAMNMYERVADEFGDEDAFDKLCREEKCFKESLKEEKDFNIINKEKHEALKPFKDEFEDLKSKWVDLEFEDTELISKLNELLNKLNKIDKSIVYENELSSLINNIKRFIARVKKMQNKNESLKEEKQSKGHRIAKIIADAINEEGGVGPYGDEEVPVNGNIIELYAQSPKEEWQFNDDGSVELLNAEEIGKFWSEDARMEDEEVTKAIYDEMIELSHFDSIEDLLDSPLSWFMYLPREEVLEKIHKVLNESLEEDYSDGIKQIIKEIESALRAGKTSPKYMDLMANYTSEKNARKELKELKAKLKSLKESKQLNEGTSNFSTPDYMPLLVFYTYDEVLDMLEYDDEYPREEEFEDENGEVDYDAYEDAKNDYEMNFFENLDVAILTEEDLEELNKDLAKFNKETRTTANGYYDDYYDDYNSLKDIELGIESGYYQAAQIAMDNEEDVKYLSDKAREEFLERLNKFIEEIKQKYYLTELEVAYRASNGETGYSIKK